MEKELGEEGGGGDSVNRYDMMNIQDQTASFSTRSTHHEKTKQKPVKPTTIGRKPKLSKPETKSAPKKG